MVDVVAPRSEDPKLIIRIINFELVQPMHPRYANVTDRQTDRQTNGRTTYDSNTALTLRASRGKQSLTSCGQQTFNIGNKMVLRDVERTNKEAE